MKRLILTVFTWLFIAAITTAQSALNFSSSDGDFVLGTNNASLNITSGTIEAWIKTPDAGNDYRGIVVKHHSYGLFLFDNELVTFNWLTSKRESTGIKLDDSKWHHVAFAFDHDASNGSTIYIDGLPVKTLTYNCNTSNDYIVAGQGSDATPYGVQHFNGTIDNVRVWNTIRTDQEIKDYYQHTLTGNEHGLVLLWQFNEGNGASTSDLSGNSNSGTLYNMDDTNWVNGLPDNYNSNLLAYFPFNGNANDESGNDNNGTVNGAALSNDRFGNPNEAYYFDGIDDGILCQNPGPTGNSSRTVTFWAKTNETPHSTWDNAVISWGSNGVYGNRFELGINSKGRGFAIDVNGSAMTYDFDNSDNEWHFYSAVYESISGGTMRNVDFYADGVLLSSTSYDNGGNSDINTSSDQPIHIGNMFGTHRFFEGSIDEIKVYDIALTPEEIKDQYDGLVGHYPLNGDVKDLSQYQHHGVLVEAQNAADRFGTADAALYFDGSNDKAFIPDAEHLGIKAGESFSVSLWLKHNAANKGKYFFSKYNGNYASTGAYAFGTGTYGDAYSWFYSLEASNGRENRGSIDLNDNEWHHYVAVYKPGENISIYIDGQLDVSNNITFNGAISNNDDLYIGCGANQAQFYNGYIDDIRIYKKALKTEDITNLFNQVATNTEKNIASKGIKVYPNPSHGELTIELSNSELSNISLFDAHGRMMMQRNKLEGLQQLNISHLDKGIYYLQIISQSGTSTQKVMKE